MSYIQRGNGLIAIIIAIMIIVICLSLYSLFSIYEASKPATQKTSRYNAPQLDNSVIFVDQNNKNFSGNSLTGKLSLIYFGVTFCHNDDNFLHKLSVVARILRKANVPINVVFISLDPEHDVPAVMKRYLAQFDRDFIGLTGVPWAIKKVAQDFHVFYRKNANHRNPDCDFEHSPFVYLIDSKGKFLGHYCLNLPM